MKSFVQGKGCSHLQELKMELRELKALNCFQMIKINILGQSIHDLGQCIVGMQVTTGH